MFVACWYQEGRMKKLAVPGCVASTLVTLLAGSAGPLSAYVFAIFALLAWRWRAHMRIFRWSVAISLVALHMVMKAPVWALPVPASGTEPAAAPALAPVAVPADVVNPTTATWEVNVHFSNDDFVCKTAKSVADAASLIEAGFDYVTEVDSLKLFRKRK